MRAADIAALVRCDVSRETYERLELFADLLAKWNRTINLISRASVDQIWTRHILDSLQLTACVPLAGHWVDLGSGGGLPGILVAIKAAEAQSHARVTLIESDQRKCAFLRTAARELELDCKIIADRIENLPGQEADILSARALAELPRLLDFAHRHMSPQGTALFPKGARWQEELDAAREKWQFQVQSIASITDPRAAILKINGVSRA